VERKITIATRGNQKALLTRGGTETAGRPGPVGEKKRTEV